MRNFFTIGPTPLDEPCAQVGTPDYHEKALPECRRFIALLRRVFGPEPPGAQLAVKSFPHDFGTYLEVVCYFDTGISESVEYAHRLDDETPTTWEG
jgi:hypothetical protein